MPNATCSVPACGRGGKILRGFCDPHYRRFLKTGDAGPALIAPRSKVKPPCSVDECEKMAYSKGYCERHYRRWSKTGETGPIGRLVRGKDSEGYVEQRERTPEERLARRNEIARETYQRNREKNLARNKRYYHRNRESQNEACRKWREANPGYHSKNAKAWYAAHPERAREIWSDKTHRRRERMQLTITVPIDYKALLAKYGMVCHLCGDPIVKDEMSWDHVVPLARGGTHTEGNLKPAHRACNSRKGAKAGKQCPSPSQMRRARRNS